MSFSKNVPLRDKNLIKAFWGAEEVIKSEKYLGLPQMVGQAKNRTFLALKQRVCRKLQGWKEKLLSQGGKEVLIKAVALSIPTYIMSCFILFHNICEDLRKMMALFWWGQKKEEQEIYSVSWQNMCKSKDEGGLGFKDLRAFNLALSAKQCWRLTTYTSSLLYQIYKARYFPFHSFDTTRLGPSPSYTWRGLIRARQLILDGTRWRIGNGQLVDLWRDYW